MNIDPKQIAEIVRKNRKGDIFASPNEDVINLQKSVTALNNLINTQVKCFPERIVEVEADYLLDHVAYVIRLEADMKTHNYLPMYLTWEERKKQLGAALIYNTDWIGAEFGQMERVDGERYGFTVKLTANRPPK